MDRGDGSREQILPSAFMSLLSPQVLLEDSGALYEALRGLASEFLAGLGVLCAARYSQVQV